MVDYFRGPATKVLRDSAKAANERPSGSAYRVTQTSTGEERSAGPQIDIATTRHGVVPNRVVVKRYAVK
jgi:hypothetical protein